MSALWSMWHGLRVGLADQSIMQLSGTFSMKPQTTPHTHLCIISALFSVSTEKMVLKFSNEGSGVQFQTRIEITGSREMRSAISV